MVSLRLNHDRAILDVPEIRRAIPTFQCAAVEHLDPALVVIEVYRSSIDVTTAGRALSTSASPTLLGVLTESRCCKCEECKGDNRNSSSHKSPRTRTEYYGHGNTPGVFGTIGGAGAPGAITVMAGSSC